MNQEAAELSESIQQPVMKMHFELYYNSITKKKKKEIFDNSVTKTDFKWLTSLSC